MDDSQGNLSSLHLPPSRTTAGRKLETWSVKLPRGKADIVISIHVSRDDMFFRATPEGHPALLGLQWDNTDLSELRAEVARDVEEVARRYYSADWKPAYAVEARWGEVSHRGNNRIIELRVRPLHVPAEQVIGNQGETRVLDNGVDTTIYQRGHRQQFEVGQGLDPANMRAAQEQSETIARAILPEDQLDQINALQAAFTNLGDAFMERLSSDRVRLEGLPSREELARLVSRAILDPEPVSMPDRKKW